MFDYDYLRIFIYFLSWPTKSYALRPYSNSTSNPILTCRLCDYYGELTKKKLFISLKQQRKHTIYKHKFSAS